MVNAFEEHDQGLPEINEQVITPLIEQRIAELENRIRVVRAAGLHATANVLQARLDKLLHGLRDPEEG